MLATQREALILGLAATAGSLDSWSYFGLGHIFIANMTGNTVMLGYSFATRDWHHTFAAGAAIFSYTEGVFVGAFLSRPIRRLVRQAPQGAILWPTRVTVILILQLLLVIAAALAASLLRPAQDTPSAYGLVCLGAVAVGLQSAAMYSLQLPGVVTTYITGTWTTIAHGVAQLLDGEERGRLKAVGFKRLGLQLAVVTVYCCAAAVSGLILRTFGHNALGWLPAALLACVTGASLAWAR